MMRAVRSSKAPIFIFQVANGYDLYPTEKLTAPMKEAGKLNEMKIHPPTVVRRMKATR